jgi:hypothetical protein
MRPKQFLMALFLLIYANSFSQTIYVVDQNSNAPSGDHIYTDLQTCIDNASDGDMIHVIPSINNYGDVIINKELHIVGSGWIPDNQTGMKSFINSIVIESSSANGTTLNGLVLTQTSDFPIYFGLLNAPLDTLKNLEIYNCKIPGIRQLDNCPIKDVILRNNIIVGLSSDVKISALSFITELGMTTDLLISNNIICVNYNYGYVRAGINAANQTLITNNLLFSNNGFYMFYNIMNCFITNNVFYGSSASSFQYGATVGENYANVYSNNLSYECTNYGLCIIPPPSTSTPANTGSGNLSDTDPLYVDLVDAWYWTSDKSLELDQFSPLLDAGTDGTDIGITGGSYPFKNYKTLIGVPYIHQMTVPGLIMENQEIQLEAEARSNQ